VRGWRRCKAAYGAPGIFYEIADHDCQRRRIGANTGAFETLKPEIDRTATGQRLQIGDYRTGYAIKGNGLRRRRIRRLVSSQRQ